MYRCRYIKDVHRTKSQALTIAIPSPYTTKIARIRRYTIISTILTCQGVEHTISKRLVFRRVREKKGRWGERREAMQSPGQI